MQRELKDKVAMMNRLQQALEHNHFFLMAQLITGMRGDVYHEILLRMKGENDRTDQPRQLLAGRARIWFIVEYRHVGH